MIAPATKPHYEILDGLRGVAALVVVWFHIFEAFATSGLDQVVNHGYLAVDFFFLLSGFVMGYAYDGRWTTMRTREFFRRRLVRLHPMVVMGAVIGAVLFYFQDSVAWHTAAVGVGALAVATLLNMLLVPVTPTAEIRGIGEMYPLNGPSWSLFFEYIGNILYALVIRRLPTSALAVWVLAAGCGLGALAISGGSIGLGWQLTGEQFIGGSLRLLFSFSAGLLLSRVFRPWKSVKGVFWICSALLVALLSLPRIGGAEHPWMNGLYEMVCCAVIFPILVCLGASTSPATPQSKGFTRRLYRFLGDISYPLYMVHYPLIYIYYGWVKDGDLTFGESLPGALGLVVASVALAWLCLKLYDIPVRRWLTSKTTVRSGPERDIQK